MKVKKIAGATGALILCLTMFGAVSKDAIAATANDSINASLDIEATISLACDAAVTMGAITGTGQSALGTNEADCNIITNNTNGYKLEWQAAAATMENANADTIGAYSPAVADTPEAWAIANNTSEWGAKLKSTSTTYDAKWGAADTYAGGNWLNVGTSAYQVVSRADETALAGDTETIIFGAEVGSNKIQPTGTYDVDVTITATTL